MPKLDERELTAILAAEKRDALSADQASRLSEEREKGLDYYNGDMTADMPSQPDRSKAVSSDVLDVVEGLMPALMEVFCAGDEVVRFNPVSEEDEPAAEQETDYVNHVFMQRNDGFVITYSFIKDALLSKNGIVKIYWEEKEDREETTVYDQPDDVYALFVADPEIEITEHTEHPPELPAPASAPMAAPIMVPPGMMDPEPPPIPGEYGVRLSGLDAMTPDMVPPGPTMPGPGPQMQNPLPGLDQGIGPPPTSGMGATSVPVGPGVLGASPTAGAPVEAPGPPPLYGPTHDFTFATKRKYGCCRVEPVPPEEFGVSRRSKLGQPLDYSFHQVQRTVAQLLDQGYDADELEDLPDSPPDENSESIARDTVEDDRTFSSSVNRANRLVTVTEHYVILDYYQDGKARLYKVTTAGGEDGQILKRKGEPDVVPVDFDPFAVTTPLIMTHRFFGKGMPDLTMDIQRVKTALYRGMLDNVYLANNQRIEISESHAGLNTIDDLLNNRPGGLVRTKQPGGLLPIPNQNLGEYVYPALEYMDTVREWRTGVVRQGQGIDADALQNQSATAVKQVYNAAQAKQKLMARIMAETGFKQLFWKMHGIIRKNEGSRPTVKLRGEWVTVDPREWKKRDDLTITVGLGSGGKAEQAAFWNQVLLIQKEALALPGQNIVKPENIYASLKKFMAAGGEKSIEPYFSDPGDPENPPGEPEPDPKMIEMQGKMELQKQQLQADQQKMMGDAQLRQAEMQARMEMEKLQAEADIASNDRKIQADIALAREKFALEREIRLLEFQLKQQETQAEVEGKAIERHTMAVEKMAEREYMAAQKPKEDAGGDSDRMQGLIKAMTAPKRVVRGPDGRVTGVETVNGAG